MTLSYSPPVPELVDRDRRSIGVWTKTGGADWAAEAYRRIYERELLARMPAARIRFIGDLADETVVVSERGDVMTSLAACAEDGAAMVDGVVAAGLDMSGLEALARALEHTPATDRPACIVSALTAADSVGPRVETIARALGTALDVSVRDAASLDRVRAWRAGDPAVLVPDPLVLLSRITAPVVTQSRIEYLRAMERYPTEHTLVVEVSAARAGLLAPLGQVVHDANARGYRLAVVALPVNGESMTADLRRAIDRAFAPAFHPESLSLEDRAAIVATAVAVVPLSPSLLAAACAFGRPSLWCREASWDRHTSIATALPGIDALIRDDLAALLLMLPDPSVPTAWCATLDAYFDRIAAQWSMPRALAGAAATASGRMAQLEAAQRITGRRLADERLRFAERTEGLLTTIAQLKREMARRTAVEAALREEMADAFARARHETSRGDLARHEAHRLEAANAQLESANTALKIEIAAIGDRINEVSRENAALARESAVRAETIDDLVCQRDELRGAVERFARSKSWRYLAPARAVGQLLRRCFGIRS
jgi:hypothetical protein